MLRLRTLGGLAVERPGASPSGGATAARRRVSLLAVLAASAPRRLARDKLVALFWPESDTDRARHALEQAVYWLKRDLGVDDFVLGREELSLNPDVITSDIGDLRAALARGDRAHAVALYAGPFLDGVFISGAPAFDHWCDSERASVQREVEQALESLAEEATGRGDHREATQWLQRLAAIDPRKTRVVLALMSELAASGDRAGALRQAHIYRTLARDDLEVEPNPAVDALVERLRREAPTPALPSSKGREDIDTIARPDTPPYAPPPAEPAAYAGRYVIERELGRGTSATVFLARDLPNGRPVALKILRPELAAGVAVARFRQEITVTANLQHPHILPVHDSGEADGSLYFVMPYVVGESLRDRLEHAPERRLPVSEALRITVEIAEALSYAHARGIVHRDVKPENVMLTSGHAVVCDFGLARALGDWTQKRRTQPGVVVGTPAYLSPERASRGDEGDARSDQYSLAYLLYESLAGERPFMSPDMVESMRARTEGAPRPVSALRSDVPANVTEALSRALSRDPADRFPDIASFARALALPAAARQSRRVHWLVAASLLLAATGAALVSSRLTNRGRIAERSFIVLADIENRTRDSVFDHAIDAALAAGLQQSRWIELLPASRVRQTLGRMAGVAASTSSKPGSGTPRLDESLAREVAQREGIRAVLVGSVDRVDSSYVLTERLVDAATGKVLASESAIAKGRSAIIETVDDLVRRMRRDIGESADALANHDRPLPRATTRSLDALRKYADAVGAIYKGQGPQAIELLQQALAIDSDFALAHAELGVQAYYGNQRVIGDMHFDRALRLLDRLTDREQFLVRAAAEEWRGSGERAIELRLALLAEYPADPTAWANIGYDYMRLRRPREAVAALNRQLSRDSADIGVHINLAEAYMDLQDYAQALQSFRRAFALQPAQSESPSYLKEEYGKALVFSGHLREARAMFDSVLTGNTDQRARGERSIGLLEMFGGHYDQAIAHFREAIILTEEPGKALSQARNRLFLAAAEQEKGRPDSARMQLHATFALFRTNYLEPTFLMFFGKALVRAGDLRLAAEVLDTLRRRVRPSNPVDVANLRVLGSEVLVSTGRKERYDSALALLQQAYAVDSSRLVAESIAHALASKGDLVEAAGRYESIATAVSQWYGWEAEPYGVTALLEAARLYEKAGDMARARNMYQQHVAQRAGGDTDLVSVREARAALARVASSTARQ